MKYNGSMKKLPTITKKCRHCKKQFSYQQYTTIPERKYCSVYCSVNGTAKQRSITVSGAGNPRYGKSPWNKGKIGVQKGKRGIENHFWKGGISDESHKARTSSKWKSWRKKVFERDDYTCQICKVRSGELIPHHIKRFKTHKKLRYNINNGKTLCKKCHLVLHNPK